MPFTPFHLGPALLTSFLFFQLLDLPSLLITSITPDIEGLYIILFTPSVPHHGLIHTYLIASILALILALVLYSLKGVTGKMMEKMGLFQLSSFPKILYTSILGTYSHIFFDSFLYPEMSPLYPLTGNPFVGVASEYIRYVAIYGLCVFAFLIGLMFYFKKKTSPRARV